MLLFLLVPFVFLLPGYAWIRLSGLKERFGLLETLALCFVLSVSAMSLFTAGLSLLTSHYLSYSVGLSLGLSLIIILVSLRHWKRSRRLLPKLNHSLVAVVGAACVYAVILATVWWSSPFYPTVDAQDILTHAQVVEAISNGLARTTLLHSNYAIGMHFVAADLSALLGLDSLDAMRLLLSLVLVTSIFLTYFCARNVLGSKCANFAVLAWAFIVPADAIHFIKIGTFPNVLSDALIIAMLWLIASYTNEPSCGLGSTLTFLAVTGLFVHSSFLIFLAALWLVLPVFYLSHRRLFGNYFRGLLFATVGLFVLFVLLGSFMSASFGRIFTGYVVSSLYSVTVFLYLQLLVYNYSFLAGPLGALSIFVAFVFILAKRRSLIWPLLLCVWFGLLMVLALISPEGWRFILLSMIPGGLLLAVSIGSLRGLGSSAGVQWSKARRALVPVLLCMLILTGGFVGLLPRVFDPSSRVREEAIVDSMSWLKQNDNGQSVASIGLFADYRYLTTLTGIPYSGDFNESANSAIAQARSGNSAYVVVALLSPQFPTFQSSNMVQEKYRNSVVAIFFIPT